MLTVLQAQKLDEARIASLEADLRHAQDELASSRKKAQEMAQVPFSLVRYRAIFMLLKETFFDEKLENVP